MFSDNETEVDLLGFDDQVADVCAIVSDPKMLPVTVGLLGDWGSGKTSLLMMAAKQLRAQDALVVEFSPWRIETYDDAKSALLDAVVSAVEDGLTPEEDTSGKGRAALLAIKRLHKKIRWMRVAGLAAKHLVTMTAPTLEEFDGLLKDDTDAEPVATSASVARRFHEEFRELVGTLGRPVVVLVDDLDRCLPEQVLDVLQAIRLFLAVPGTAFVLATDERVVRDAVRLRYPQAAAASETDLPQEYLEKIVQVPIRIPPLGPAQVETYLNLLVAEKYCDFAQVEALREHAAGVRSEHYLAVAMNLGIARDTLAPAVLPSEAEHDFEIISRTARLLSTALKGNPRQAKRFMNMLLLRRATARRRELEIDDAVLAKLAVLEYTHVRHFQILYRWQSQADGRPHEIRQAEQAVTDQPPEEASPEIAEWTTNPWLRAWLATEPPLADTDLNAYFVLARDALTATAVSARRLPVRLQKLLAGLSSTAPAQRSLAARRAKDLEPDELLAIVEAGIDRLGTTEDPGPLALALIDAAAGREDLLRALISSFSTLPYGRLSGAFPAQIQQAVGDLGTTLLPELLRTWEKQGVNATLSKAAYQARQFTETGS